MALKLPAGCGDNLNEPLLVNEYQQAFMKARRLRFCLKCKLMGSMDENSVFVCPKCKTNHTSNMTAPRAFNRFLLLSGRGGGKTLIGAHAAREEMMVPNSIGWVMGPTYKILHDSTIPTLVKLINPEWVKRWDPEHNEITLHNGALVAFRSLEDPERARGPHGVGWGWFDEAAQCPLRAYKVFEPTLMKAGGIVIATTTVFGYDWTYEEIEQKALVYQEPGYWACRYYTEHNPLFQINPVMRADIERARKTWDPDLFAQEYQAERRNATGLVYGPIVERQVLKTDEDVRKFIPEWPDIDTSRPVIIGLDSGADHPFGAVKVVVTARGLIVVDEYLQRMQAVSQQLPMIQLKFETRKYPNITWAANKNEANLRLEFGLKGIGVIPAEAKHEIGIQRTASWLHSKQLYFAATRVSRTIEQMRAYRYADNLKPDGSKQDKEKVFKHKDELPDALRYAIMAWPELPDDKIVEQSEDERKRFAAFSDKTKREMELAKELRAAEKDPDLKHGDKGYPLGDFWGKDTVGEDFDDFQGDMPWM